MTTLAVPALLTAGVIALASCASAGGRPGAGGGAPVPSSGSVSAGAGQASASPGQVVTPAPPRPSSPSPRVIHAGQSGAVRLSQSDNGATVVLAPGQSVSVVLGGRGQLQWDPPFASGSQASQVLRRTLASGGYPTTAAAMATFSAVRPGHAVISSASDAACLHRKPACELAQQVWLVTVVVAS